MRHLRMAAIALGLPAALGLPGAPTAALASGHEAVPLFQSASRCLVCHNGLKSVAGHDASIGAQWRSSVMANSARDPYWRAGVSREIVDHPEARDHIQQECAACHLPIAHAQATLANRRSLPFDLLAPPAGHADVQLAMEGVNCSVCHQIQDSGLGEPATFNGEFRIAPPDPHGVRPEYGPYVIDAGRQLIMRSSSGGFEPRHGAHVADSKLCASCHTLFTAPLGESTPVGAEFPEQMPWFEWLHSRYREERSCQSCHMPAAPDDAPVSAVLGTPRPAPAGHSFSGANVFMQRLFAAHREALGISVPGAELEAAAEGTERFLKEQAASVSIERTSLQQGRLVAQLRVTNLGGHKLPTAYPSRRVWLHVCLTDAAGVKVFESGALNPDGSITGNDNDADPTRFEPHYAQIRSADQVQIYEDILGTRQGKVTTALLAASHYLKDNRLLPQGFDKASADRTIAVVGDAAQDPGFDGQGHRIRYSVELGAAPGPYRLEAEIWYQPIGFRWAKNLEAYDTAQVHEFRGLVAAAKGVGSVRLSMAWAVAQAPALIPAQPTAGARRQRPVARTAP